MTWLHHLFLAIIKYPARWLISGKSIPTDLQSELGLDPDKPVLYLLKTRSATDLIALEKITEKLKLPSPTQPLELAGESLNATLYLEQPQSLLSRKVQTISITKDFARIFKLHRDVADLDLQILPVSVLWGRAPDKPKQSWAELLTDRASPSWLRKLFIVLFLGRDNFVCFSKAVSSRWMVENRGTDEQLSHKLIRVARTHFYRRRQAMNGPGQWDRQNLFNAVLGSSAVKQAIAEEQKAKNISQDKSRQLAQKYVDEIAADYREGAVRIADRLLTRIWNKIYNGIEVKNADKVRDLAQNGHEIVYVPCHRSHMDYLLLTYVIYHQGLVPPHIAAGINLNFWPVGSIFRRAGAFFIRRSFAGNKLYTAVFKEYLEQLFSRGYSVKYYPEGGRSRTGRLLPPKTGMLAMTVQAMFKEMKRPISIVPVYIGYEHVMEVASYLKELQGKDKKKESIFQVFSAIRNLRNYGHGYLSFGDPIHLGQFMEQQVPDWRASVNASADKKPSWLTPTVNKLANTVMCRINQAAAINGMALSSACLLAADKHALSEPELENALSHYLQLFTEAPFSDEYSLPQQSARELLDSTIKLNKFHIEEDQFGRIISLDNNSAIAQTYYRNNILHMLALPGLIAAGILAHNGLEKTQVLALVQQLYPLLQKELFIYMDEAEAVAYTEKLLQAMKSVGLLQQKGRKIVAADRSTPGHFSLTLLSRMLQETLQRYALVLTLLEREERLNRSALENQSRQLAERLSSLHGINAPEFYDKNVLATFVSALKENQWVEECEDGRLQHSEQSAELQQQVMALIAPEVAQSIRQIQ